MASTLNKIRLGILVFVGIPGCLCAGVVGIATYIVGDGKVTVLAGADPVTVSADGKELAKVAPGEHAQVKLAQGKHTLTMASASGTVETPVDIDNGFTNLFWGGGKDRCYAEVDVTDYVYYTFSQGKAYVEKTFHGDQLVDLDHDVYFSSEELPKSLKKREEAKLLLEVDCSLLDRKGDALLSAMGF